jgi:hypothetical protein
VKVIDLASRYIDWLSEAYRADPRYLALIRIVFAVLVLLEPNHWAWVAEVPPDFVAPRLFLSLATETMPSPEVITGLMVARYAFAAALLVGWQTMPVSIGLSVLLMIESAFSYSFGKVDHFILFETLPFFMAAAGWGRALSLDNRHRRVGPVNGLPILLWGMTIAFAYLTAAVPKAVSGWLDPQREGTRGFFALDLIDGQMLGVFAGQFRDFESPVFWKALDYSAVVLEGWLVVAIAIPVLFRAGMLFICGFHVGVYLLLGIDFSTHIIVYAVFFSPWIVGLYRRYLNQSSTDSHRDPTAGGSEL